MKKATTANATANANANARIEKYEIDFFNYDLFREIFYQNTGTVTFYSEQFPLEGFDVDTTPIRSRSGIERYKVTYASGKSVIKTENGILSEVFTIYFRFADAYCKQIKTLCMDTQRSGDDEFEYKLDLNKVINEETREYNNFMAFLANLENAGRNKGYDLTSIRNDGLLTFKHNPKYGASPRKDIREQGTLIFTMYRKD